MKAGLYFHIPFCLKKCAYCDFYSIPAEQSLIERFLNACYIEIELYAEHPIFSQAEFQTVYFGGGTPSLLSVKLIDRLIQQIQNIFKLVENFELTLEANPETLSITKLTDYYSIGINRLSIGIQSFSSSELKLLGRIHKLAQANKCIEWAYQAGFENINLDLIFAVPGQSLMDWQENVKQAIRFDPQHLSAYCLTIEHGTLLEKQVASGKLIKVNDETEREMYLSAIDTLTTAGYQQYEISNFALPGFKCKHNLMYWNGSPYLGIGPSAHSFWNEHRQWNVDSINHYLQSLKDGNKPIAGQEILSPDQQLLEFIYLNLRTTGGIDLQQFENRFHIPFLKRFNKVVDKLQNNQDGELYHCKGNRFILTPPGLVLFDEICQYFADEI